MRSNLKRHLSPYQHLSAKGIGMVEHGLIGSLVLMLSLVSINAIGTSIDSCFGRITDDIRQHTNTAISTKSPFANQKHPDIPQNSIIEQNPVIEVGASPGGVVNLPVTLNKKAAEPINLLSANASKTKPPILTAGPVVLQAR